MAVTRQVRYSPQGDWVEPRPRSDRWITMQEAAQLLNETRPPGVRLFTVGQTRRRLKFLDSEARQRGASGLLKRFGRASMMVSAEALLRELRTDPNLHETRTSALESQVADLEQKVVALRNSLRSVKQAVRKLSTDR